jgi:ABC-type branched-subunit amino acid transport system ATPase component
MGIGALSAADVPAALEVVALHMDFDGVHAVDGASFQVAQGTITGLIGPNGAGKSTVVDIISGFRKPTSGQVMYQGEDISAWAPHRVARAGVVRTFQLSSEFERLSVMENVLAAVPGLRGNDLWGAVRGRRYWRAAQSEAVAEAEKRLEEFGLSGAADAYAGELSGGQKRLLEMVRAITARPRILLLDEPFAGVNPSLVSEIETIILRLREEGLTILLVEHAMGSIERLCDDIIVMALGRVLVRGTMSEIRAHEKVVDAYLGA